MLSIERKKTDKVDFDKPIETFIRNNYSADALQDHQSAIHALQQLREDVRNIQDKNDQTKELYLRYLAQVYALEAHFPISENQVRIQFTWYDCLKNKKVAEYSIHYEKANVLFNVGAMYSQLGCLQNRSTAEGLKAACQNFQSAAGAFMELKNELEKHPKANVLDFSVEFVNSMINVMLAQAQECFYEKAVKDDMNAAVVAKLAAQVSEFYDVTKSLFESQVLSSIVPKNWLPHVQMKSAIYKANANYRTGLAHGKSEQYGPQVARLKHALNILEDAKKKHFKNASNDLQQVFNTVHGQISKSLATCEKENDTIYHDTVPSEASLGEVEKKVIVKGLPIPENILKLDKEVDPFSKLIPFAITEKLSVYQERKDTLVRDFLRSIDEQNQLAIGSLQSMSLPGSIEALDGKPGIPDALKEKMKKIRPEGGAGLILEQVELLSKLSEECLSIIKNSVHKLDDEEVEDNKMRETYPGRWQRTPSHTLTANLRQEYAKYHGNLDHARKSDAIVLKKFQDNQQFIVKLTAGEDEIIAMIPDTSAKSNSQVAPFVESLKQLLSSLDKAIAERTTLRTAVTTLSQHDDISGRLMSKPTQVTDEEVFNEELGKYSDIRQKLDANFAQQVSLLAKIQEENAKFVAARQSSGAQMNFQREQVLQGLNNACKIYDELKNNLREGIKFYTNFQEILRQFSAKCQDFVFARQTEKHDLISDIQRSQASQASQAYAAPSPPVNNYPQYQQPNQYPQYQTPPPPQYPPAQGQYNQPYSSQPASYQGGYNPGFAPQPFVQQPQQPQQPQPYLPTANPYAPQGQAYQQPPQPYVQNPYGQPQQYLPNQYQKK